MPVFNGITAATPNAFFPAMLPAPLAAANAPGAGSTAGVSEYVHAENSFGKFRSHGVFRRAWRGSAMRGNIALKIFGIALGLLVLMGAAALLSLRMTQTVDDQLVIVDQNYFPAYVAWRRRKSARRGIGLIRRLVIALGETPRDDAEVADLRSADRRRRPRRATTALAEARKHINEQIADPLDFNDNVALGRLDTRVEFLQEDRRPSTRPTCGKLIAAADAHEPRCGKAARRTRHVARRFRAARIDSARSEMRQLAGDAIDGTRNYQMRVVDDRAWRCWLSPGCSAITVAGGVSMGLVRPVRRLLAGTAAVERGVLDTVVPVTSRDEIGRLTHAFNNMVGELRKQGADPRDLRQIRRSAHRRRADRPAGADRPSRARAAR